MTEGTLEARLGRLERENRRLRLGMLAVVAAVGALVCVAATNPAPEVVRAQKFEVVDAEGRVRIQLGMGGAEGQSPGMRLCDEKGEVRAELSLLAGGSPGLALYDEKGKGRAELALLPDGSPGLVLFDREGKVIWRAVGSRR